MVSIPAFQAGGPGSIPGQRNVRAISLAVMIPRCQRGGPGSTPGWRKFFYNKIIFWSGQKKYTHSLCGNFY